MRVRRLGRAPRELSTVHPPEATILLSEFVDIGPWDACTQSTCVLMLGYFGDPAAVFDGAGVAGETRRSSSFIPRAECGLMATRLTIPPLFSRETSSKPSPTLPPNLSLDGIHGPYCPRICFQIPSLDLLELDHGGVSVVTSKSFKVRVNCILVVPVMNEWTQHVVTDLNGTVQVAARKLDVNVEHDRGRGKEGPESQPSQESASVHEGEQKSYDESKVCGPGARPTSSWGGISPKWIAAGAAGAGILIWLLIHGGNPKPRDQPSSAVASPWVQLFLARAERHKPKDAKLHEGRLAYLS